MSTKNPRNAGRKPLPENEKMVKCGGGMVSQDTIKWIKKTAGMKCEKQ